MKKIKKAIFILLSVCVLFSCVFVGGCKNNNSDGRTNYDIVCSYSNGVLTGTEKVEFYNSTSNAFKEIKFNLFGNAFRENAKYSPISAQYLAQAYPNGLSYGDMQILSVKNCDKTVNFSICGQDENILSVELVEEIFPEESTLIEIEFSLKLASVIARTGINNSTINLANFYPIICGIQNDSFYECVYYSCGDPFYSDCSNYTVTFSTDKKYKVASSGVCLSQSEQNEKTTYNFKLDNARSFAMVLSENFSLISKEVDNVKVNYYYYNDSQPEESLLVAEKSIKLYNNLFGKYPYSTYSVVQTKFVQGGMEFPTLVLISDTLEREAYNEVIAHETAHQWWQTAVGNNEIEHPFLDEGLAEYSVVLFYENYPEYNLTREQVIDSARKTYKTYFSVYDKLFGSVDTTMLRSLDQYKSEYEYVNIAYIKPCIMLDTLRTTIGETKFFKGLKNYYSKYCFLNATPSDLVGVYEKIGADTNGFFDSFFNGKVLL